MGTGWQAKMDDALREWLLGDATKLLGNLQQARQTEGAQLAQSLQTRITQLRQLCQRAGVPICKSPHCADCCDYRICFGPEEA